MGKADRSFPGEGCPRHFGKAPSLRANSPDPSAAAPAGAVNKSIFPPAARRCGGAKFATPFRRRSLFPTRHASLAVLRSRRLADLRRLGRRPAAAARARDVTPAAAVPSPDQLHDDARVPHSRLHPAGRRDHPARRIPPALRGRETGAHLGDPGCHGREPDPHAVPRPGIAGHRFRRQQRRTRSARARVSPSVRRQRPVLRLVHGHHHDVRGRRPAQPAGPLSRLGRRREHRRPGVRGAADFPARRSQQSQRRPTAVRARRLPVPFPGRRGRWQRPVPKQSAHRPRLLRRRDPDRRRPPRRLAPA